MLTIFHIFFSAHNTMYLEVHCPAVRPHVVVVSDCGRTVVDFENVSLGKISYSLFQTRELVDFIVIKLVCVRSICYPPIMRKFKANRPVSYSNGWTGFSMKWRLMRAN